VREREEAVGEDRFVVDHGRPALRSGATETVGYSWDGLVIGDHEHPHCLCKTVKDLDTGTRQHFVKFSVAGHTAGSMVDPEEENDLARRGDWSAAGRFRFRAVPKEAFDLYLNFVKTGNRAYLRQAGRLVEA
jgi:hypothetical protein